MALTKQQIANEIESRTGIKPTLAKRVIDELGNIIQEQVVAGNDVSIKGVVRIAYRYTAPRKKGDTYTGFGGVEQTAEKNTPEKVALSVGYPGGKAKLLPAKGSKGYKAVIARKAK